MELEDLKTRWEELSRRLERQQITTRSLMENTVRQRRWSIAAYTWFNLITMVLGIPLVIGIGLYRGVTPTFMIVGIALLVIAIPWVAYQAVQLHHMQRMSGNIAQQELCTVRYKKALVGSYLYAGIVLTAFIGYLFAVRTEWAAAGYDGNFKLIVIIGVCALVGSLFVYRWEAERIRALRKALADLREFTAE